MLKLFFSISAVILTFTAFWPYIRSIQCGKTTPHVFSWIIWGLTTFIVFFAQLAGRGGLGAWPIGVSGVITIYIALLAYRKHPNADITQTDWAFLIAALSALPFWFLTANPLWTVIILTTVDVVGFGPTFRSAYSRPHSERIGFFSLFAIRNLLVILALEHYSLTTVLFPAVVGLACLILAMLIAYRRRLIAN